MNRITDENLIKALKQCSSRGSCSECPMGQIGLFSSARSCYDKLMDKASKRLRELTSTSVETPVVHGHWIPHKIVDGQCSNCKKVQWLAMTNDWQMNYCPNCGAKMDEKDGDSDGSD